jgi:predicted neuraminidase
MILRRLLIAALAAMLALLYWQSRQSLRSAALPLAAPVYHAATTPQHTSDFIGDEVRGQMCHVSSIAPLSDGRMAAVWYAGSREGAADVTIYFSELSRTNWSKPRVLLDAAASRRELGRWVKKLGNPVLFRDSTHRLWLFYASVAAGGWSTCSLNYKTSTDGGSTWSRSEKLILSPLFNLTHNVKNKALLLDDGSFLLPIYSELIRKQSDVLRVRPGGDGIGYQVERMTHSGRAIQPALIPLGGTRLVALFRNMQGGPLLSSASADTGQTWTGLKSLAQQNPDAGLDAIRLDSGALLAALNGGTNRATLGLFLSEDEGMTWRLARALENQPGREYSYPSMARDDAGNIHLSYTFERRRIKHQRFNEAWIREGLR